MRILTFLLLLCVLLLAAGCQTAAPAATRPANTEAPGPLDNVTNPLNQPRFDSHGTMR